MSAKSFSSESSCVSAPLLRAMAGVASVASMLASAGLSSVKSVLTLSPKLVLSRSKVASSSVPSASGND